MRFLLRPWCWLFGHHANVFDVITGGTNVCSRCLGWIRKVGS